MSVLMGNKLCHNNAAGGLSVTDDDVQKILQPRGRYSGRTCGRAAFAELV